MCGTAPGSTVGLMDVAVLVIVLIAVGALLLLAAAIRIIKHYERGVQFRLGKLYKGARGPGLILIIPLVDRLQRVSMRIVTMPIQSQGIITRDNVPARVNAVVLFQVLDPEKSVMAVENFAVATTTEDRTWQRYAACAGMPEARIDVTGLWGAVEGYAITALESPRVYASSTATAAFSSITLTNIHAGPLFLRTRRPAE